MKGKTFLILLIISLLAINAFTLVGFHQYKKQAIISESVLSHQKGSESDELLTYKGNLATGIMNSNIRLDEDIVIKDSLNNVFPLKDAFENGQKYLLVGRFSEMHCESCVDFSIHMLRRWADSIKIENVLFLGEYRNNRIFNRTKPLYGIQNMKTYNVPIFNIPTETLGYPYYFVLDGDLHISNVFVPDKATPNVTGRYLENVKKKFWRD